MSSAKTSASACVEVAADPARAFEAFTGEIDSWWVRGPINFFDAARAVEMRIEPGVDGRILEVYEGDAFELGKLRSGSRGAAHLPQLRGRYRGRCPLRGCREARVR